MDKGVQTKCGEYFLNIKGMTCLSCSNTVESCVKSVEGVSMAIVSLKNAIAFTIVTEETHSKLLSSISASGFEAEVLQVPDEDFAVLKKQIIQEATDSAIKDSSQQDFFCKIDGMTCSSCSGTVEACLKDLKDVEGVAVSLATGIALVQASANVAKDMIEKIDSVGFDAIAIPASSLSTAFKTQMKQSMKIKPIRQNSKQSLNGEEKLDDQKLLTNEMVGSDTLSMAIDGMTCTSCSGAVERALKNHPGVVSAIVNLATDTAVVTFDAALTGPRDMIQTVKDAGYGCQILDSDQPNLEEMEAADRKKNSKRLRVLCLSTVLSLPIVLISMVFKHAGGVISKELYEKKIVGELALGPLLMWILCTPVQFGIGWRFYKGAAKGWRNRVLGMDFLVAMGTSAAYLYSAFAAIQCVLGVSCTKDTSFFETSAVLITFVLLGKYLEGLVKGKTTEALTKLLSYQAQTAVLVAPDGTESEVDAKMIQKGDLVKLLRGSKMPADGVVMTGELSVDESMITGESVPVLRKAGDPLIGGTVCVEGLATMEVQKTGKETTLQQIVNLVETAQTSKAPIQNFADRISHVFVPVVVLISIVTFIVWISLLQTDALPVGWFGADLSEAERWVVAVKFAVAVLVVACPCALGLATPTAIMTGTGTAALYGILIKGGDVLQQTKDVTSIIFDKTGTLTHGKPMVSDFHVVIAEDKDQNLDSGGPKLVVRERFFPKELLSVFAAVENNSEHPLGKAVTDYARSHNITKFAEVSQFKASSGKGVSGYVNNNHVFIGTATYMKEMGVASLSASAKSLIQTMQWQGKTVICGGMDGTLVAIFGIMDGIRAEAKRTIAHLKSTGIDVYMVTGDSKRTAHAVANQLGLTEDFVFAEVLPQFKAETVKDLQKQGEMVAMVGDGINDAPALAQANLGIAIGAGTDIAIEAADLVLMKSRVTDVITTISISRTIFRRIKLNFGWALGYNCLGIPIASGIFYPLLRTTLPPMVAGAAMAMSSICVVLSSLHLKWYKPPEVAREEVDDTKEGRPLEHLPRPIAPIYTATNKVEDMKNAWIERNLDQANLASCDCPCEACQNIRKDFSEGKPMKYWDDICIDRKSNSTEDRDADEELISEVTVLLEKEQKCACTRCLCEHHEYASMY